MNALAEPSTRPPETDLPPLWHFTCDHAHALIVDFLVPNRKSAVPMVWLTDLALPVRDALGLTSDWIDCDRTAHRYRVTDSSEVTPYYKVRRLLPPDFRVALESAPGVLLRHWFVSSLPVPVEYAPWR